MGGEQSGTDENEVEFECSGVRVLSDSLTLEMINGSRIMYKEEMIRSAFEVVDNP